MHQAARSKIGVSAPDRKDRLRRLLGLLQDNAGAFETAISADFGHRSVQEIRFAEALFVEAGIKLALRRIDHWMRPKRIPTAWHFWPGSNRLIPQPLGVAGIISPWNYPLQLTLAPLVGALAAGNRIMIKPSELVPQFSSVLAAAVGKHFDAAEVAVVEGGPAVSQAFAALPFDHLLFTGSARVGRLVAEVAARNLTPITLELGGKSPAIIDRSADVAAAARRIAIGKLLNAGQTCIAPDYVLCPGDAQDAFVTHYFKSVTALYGTDPHNQDYTSIVTETHYDRLEGLLSDAIAKGGRIDRHVEDISVWKSLRKFPPCLVLSTTDEMRMRQEEIFGPILAVIPYDQEDEAIAYVNGRDRPLALYWFGADRHARDRILRETISGGVTINDCLLHLAQEHQPFGGVGASGMGAYHGEWGFRTFSKEKPVFNRGRVSVTVLLQPPYGRTFDRALALLRRLL
ncbi:MAG: coniferyl aldehyde dehydrogenase [Pseudolabrys sp.]